MQATVKLRLEWSFAFFNTYYKKETKQRRIVKTNTSGLWYYYWIVGKEEKNYNMIQL